MNFPSLRYTAAALTLIGTIAMAQSPPPPASVPEALFSGMSRSVRPGTDFYQYAWYRAFGLKPGDAMYLAPRDRVQMW